MGRRRARLLEQERPKGSSVARLKAGSSRSEDREPVTRELMRLQRSGGNEAVSTMLARKVTQTADKDNPSDKPVTSTLVMEDTPVGVLPLISFSRGQNGEYVALVPSSSADAMLFDMAAKGKPAGKVKISIKSFTIDLDETYISSAQITSHGDDSVIQLTLNVKRSDAGYEKPPAGKLD